MQGNVNSELIDLSNRFLKIREWLKSSLYLYMSFSSDDLELLHTSSSSPDGFLMLNLKSYVVHEYTLHVSQTHPYSYNV